MGKHKRQKLDKLKISPVKTSHKVSNKQPPAGDRRHSAGANPPTIPFDVEDRILTIGEGDFSFSLSLVKDHNCHDVVATCYDSMDELHKKYAPQVIEHLNYLEEAGQRLLYSVDATKLDQDKPFRKRAGDGLFDRIFFNFPHVGGKSKDVNRQVRYNQELLVNFFGSAISLLTPSGTIVVTLFEGEPYTLWNIRDLARHAGLQVIRSFQFVASAYPSYRHARTLGNIDGKPAWKGEDRDARSYVFGRKDHVSATSAGEKRKQRHEGDSDDDD